MGCQWTKLKFPLRKAIYLTCAGCVGRENDISRKRDSGPLGKYHPLFVNDPCFRLARFTSVESPLGTSCHGQSVTVIFQRIRRHILEENRF